MLFPKQTKPPVPMDICAAAAQKSHNKIMTVATPTKTTPIAQQLDQAPSCQGVAAAWLLIS